MSILIGNSKKFKDTQGVVTLDASQKNLKIQNPYVFSKLATSNRHTLSINPQEQLPYDASDSFLRTLSPFILQIEPPLIYQNIALSKHRVNVDIYSQSNKNVFIESRNNLLSSNIGAPLVPVSEPSVSQGGLEKEPNTNTSRNYPILSDLQTAIDQAVQLDTVLKTPPLVLLINPQSFDRSFVKVQTYQDRTRQGYVFHSWGEEQPKINFSIRCGAFISGQRGVQNVSKKDSLAWQNLINVMTFYKNNGYIYDTFGDSMANLAVGCLSIHYDQWIYYGHMESLNYSIESNMELGGVTFEIGFKVSLMVDTSTNSIPVEPLINPTNPYDLVRTPVVSNDAGDYNINFSSRVVGPSLSSPQAPKTGSQRPLRGVKGFTQGQPSQVTLPALAVNPIPFRKAF